MRSHRRQGGCLGAAWVDVHCRAISLASPGVGSRPVDHQLGAFATRASHLGRTGCCRWTRTVTSQVRPLIASWDRQLCAPGRRSLRVLATPAATRWVHGGGPRGGRESRPRRGGAHGAHAAAGARGARQHRRRGMEQRARSEAAGVHPTGGGPPRGPRIGTAWPGSGPSGGVGVGGRVGRTPAALGVDRRQSARDGVGGGAEGSLGRATPRADRPVSVGRHRSCRCPTRAPRLTGPACGGGMAAANDALATWTQRPGGAAGV